MDKKKKKKFTRKTLKERLDLRIPKSLKNELEEYCQITDQSITSAVVKGIKKLIREK